MQLTGEERWAAEIGVLETLWCRSYCLGECPKVAACCLTLPLRWPYPTCIQGAETMALPSQNLTHQSERPEPHRAPV